MRGLTKTIDLRLLAPSIARAHHAESVLAYSIAHLICCEESIESGNQVVLRFVPQPDDGHEEGFGNLMGGIGVFGGAGPLSSGVTLMLVGTAVGGVLIAWGRGLKSVISAPRSGLAPVFATMVAAIFVATIVNGVALYFMGQAKLGSMVRYKP